MNMSEGERRLLVGGTLDTSGVGAGAHERLPEVSLAWNTGESLVLALAEKDEVAISVEELLVDGKDPIVAAAERTAAKEALREAEAQVPAPEEPKVVEPDAPKPEPAQLVDRPRIPVKQAAKKTTAPQKRATPPAKS